MNRRRNGNIPTARSQQASIPSTFSSSFSIMQNVCPSLKLSFEIQELFNFSRSTLNPDSTQTSSFSLCPLPFSTGRISYPQQPESRAHKSQKRSKRLSTDQTKCLRSEMLGPSPDRRHGSSDRPASEPLCR